MKKFLFGGVTGYLLTSIFSIPPLPSYFWYTMGGICVMALIGFLGWRRFNDDMHEGDF